MRHHRGAEHAGGQQHGLWSLEARYQSRGDTRRVGRTDEEAGKESDCDDAEQEHDDELEGPLFVPCLHGEQGHGNAADDHGTEGEWQSEERVERDCAGQPLPGPAVGVRIRPALWGLLGTGWRRQARTARQLCVR